MMIHEHSLKYKMSHNSIIKQTYADAVIAPLRIFKLMSKFPTDIVYVIMSFLMNFDYKNAEKWLYYLDRNFIINLRSVMFYKFPSIYLINIDGNVNNKICNFIVTKYNGKKFLITPPELTHITEIKVSKPITKIKHFDDKFIDVEVNFIRQNKLNQNKQRSMFKIKNQNKRKSSYIHIRKTRSSYSHIRKTKTIGITRERLYKNITNNILYDKNGEFVNINDYYYDDDYYHNNSYYDLDYDYDYYTNYDDSDDDSYYYDRWRDNWSDYS